VTTHVVRLKVFRLKTEGEREPRELFSGIKGIKPQGKPWTRFYSVTPPQADGVLKNHNKAVTVIQ